MATRLMLGCSSKSFCFKSSTIKIPLKSQAGQSLRRNLSSLKEQLKETEKHAEETYVNWRNISIFVAIPVCSYLFYKHMIVGEHLEKPKEFVPFDHMRIRKKPFPWGDGDKSLFHNPEYNVGPDTDFEEHAEEEEKEHVPFITRIFLRFMETEEESIAWRDKHLARMRLIAIENIESRRKPDLPRIHFDVVGNYDKTPKPREINVDE